MEHGGGQVLLATEEGRVPGTVGATKDRLHQALDRYEQFGETRELEHMMETPLNSLDHYQTQLSFPEMQYSAGQAAHFSVEGFDPLGRAVADQASELLSSLAARATQQHRGNGRPRSANYPTLGRDQQAYFVPSLVKPRRTFDGSDDDDRYSGDDGRSDDEPVHRARPTALPSRTSQRVDEAGRPKHYVGAYSPESRKRRIELFHEKRKQRVWTRKVKYDVRKNFADTRMRVKGRFVKKEDEDLLKELLAIV